MKSLLPCSTARYHFDNNNNNMNPFELIGAQMNTIRDSFMHPVDSKEFTTYATSEFIEGTTHDELETIVGELSAKKKQELYDILSDMLAD